MSNIRASIEPSLCKCYRACIKVSKRGELYFNFTWSSSPIFLIFLSITSQIHHEATLLSSSSASPRGDVVMHFLRFLSWCRRRTKPSWAWSGFFITIKSAGGDNDSASMSLLINGKYSPTLCVPPCTSLTVFHCQLPRKLGLIPRLCYMFTHCRNEFSPRDHVSCPRPNGRLLVVNVAIR